MKEKESDGKRQKGREGRQRKKEREIKEEENDTKRR